MFNKKDVVFWLWNIAVLDDRKGGYIFVDWANSERRMHIGNGGGSE